jgi:subtilisin-like proprotein convertase family protein
MMSRSGRWSRQIRGKGVSWAVVASMLAMVPAPVVRAADNKEAIYAEMEKLGSQIDAVKGGPAAAGLLMQYRALSAQMGGDDPANLLHEGRASRPGVAVPHLGGGPGPTGCLTTTQTFTQSTPTAIPTGPAVVTSTVVVAGAGSSILDVDLLTNLTHTFAADLDITIQSPTGTIVTLTTDNGAGNDNVFNGTLWDDDANPAGQVPYTTNNGMVTDHAYVNLTTATPLAPEEPFGAFNGENPNGTWTITISDDLAGDGGSLDNWSLTFNTGTCFVRGDFSGDSKTDILWRHDFSGENVVWFMNGTVLTGGTFTTPSSLTDVRWKMVGTHDFNADSKTDILWRHETSGENVVWFMNGTVLTGGTFTTPSALADTNWKMAGTGDFNQDGKPDIAWHHIAAGQIVVWFMNGTVLTSGTFTTPSTMSLAYRLVGVADFSAPLDGKPDLVWRNPSTGDNLIWLMNGTTQLSSVTTQTLTDSRWELVATGDFNQDQKNDFVWRHSTSGENVVWFMNGPNFVGGTFTTPSAFTDVRWKMVGPR